jgi:hypothetical protein
MDADQLAQVMAAIGNININVPPPAAGGRRMTPFSSGEGTDWSIWRRTFTQTAQINVWNDERQRREAIAGMEGAAGKMVQDINWDTHANIGALLDALENRFRPAADGELAQADFECAEQRDGESVIQWHSRCRELFVRAFPNQPVAGNPRQLLNKFVLGLADADVRADTYKARPNNWENCLTEANNHTAAKQVLANHSATAAKGRRGNNHVKPEVNNLNRFGKPIKCFICGGPHMQRACPCLEKAQKFLDNKKEGGNGNKKKNKGKPNNRQQKPPTGSVSTIDKKEGDEGHDGDGEESENE